MYVCPTRLGGALRGRTSQLSSGSSWLHIFRYFGTDGECLLGQSDLPGVNKAVYTPWVEVWDRVVSQHKLEVSFGPKPSKMQLNINAEEEKHPSQNSEPRTKISCALAASSLMFPLPHWGKRVPPVQGAELSHAGNSHAGEGKDRRVMQSIAVGI